MENIALEELSLLDLCGRRVALGDYFREHLLLIFLAISLDCLAKLTSVRWQNTNPSSIGAMSRSPSCPSPSLRSSLTTKNCIDGRSRCSLIRTGAVIRVST